MSRTPKGIDCELVGIEVENLRGFRKAALSLERDLILLVGPNNSGKTSLLRLLDWAINGSDDDLLSGRRELTESERHLLLPARDTRGAARRLTLLVRIADGRTARRFDAIDRIARIRFQLVRTRVFVAVKRPKRSEPRSSDADAIELLEALKATTRLVLVPSSRDAASERFEATLSAAIRSHLAERALHSRRGGAPTEYRKVKSALKDLSAITDDLVEPLWNEMDESLIPGLARIGDFSLAASPETLIDWLVSQIEFSLSTGDHDERRVKPSEVGSGLQSLLDLAVMSSSSGEDVKGWLLVEEPEAFLHPSAQRSVAQSLRKPGGLRRVVSTHSPLVAEESEYGELVLVRDHDIYEPAEVGVRRGEINTAYQTGLGAEALFARSVLLVEGPGDRAFFEALRRRLAHADSTGSVNSLVVVDVGGKNRFGPWIHLFRSYGRDGDLPVRWLAVADSVDGVSDLAKGVRDARVSIPAPVAQLLRRIPALFRDGLEADAIEASSAVNAAALESGARLALSPVDLEYLMLSETDPATCRGLSDLIGHQYVDKDALLRYLGSKYGAGPITDPQKAPWVRSVFGQEIAPKELSVDAKAILRMWLRGAIEDASEIDELLDELR